MFLVLLVLFVILLYMYLTKNHDYWAKRNIKFDKPLPFFGNHLPNVLVKRTTIEVINELYKKHPNEKMVGYYRGMTPELIVKDLDIIKHILITDFSYFHSRNGIDLSPKDPLLYYSLFFIVGEKWNILRQKTSAAFTTAKLKAMFPLILECAQKFQDTAENIVMDGKEIKTYDLMARYSLECIGTCGFGLNLGVIHAEYSEFLNEIKLFFNKTKWQIFYLTLQELYPTSIGIYRTHAITKVMSDTLLDITKKVQQERDYKPCGRNDFMDTLLDMASKEKPLTSKSFYKKDSDMAQKEVTLEMDLTCIAAQVSAILFAGFESTATSTSFTLHQLAYNPQAQLKIQQEIDKISREHGQLSYENLEEMSWLKMALKESLRMLPPTGMIKRVCNKKYTIPGTGVTIDPGVNIFIPTQAIHMDPQYFDNPTEYRPERFASDATKPRKYVYMPFGEGPRKCPGIRLGYLQAMAGVAAVLQKFTVSPASTSQKQHTVKKSSFLVQVLEGGVPLKFTPRSV